MFNSISRHIGWCRLMRRRRGQWCRWRGGRYAGIKRERIRAVYNTLSKNITCGCDDSRCIKETQRCSVSMRYEWYRTNDNQICTNESCAMLQAYSWTRGSSSWASKRSTNSACGLSITKSKQSASSKTSSVSRMRAWHWSTSWRMLALASSRYESYHTYFAIRKDLGYVESSDFCLANSSHITKLPTTFFGFSCKKDARCSNILRKSFSKKAG